MLNVPISDIALTHHLPTTSSQDSSLSDGRRNEAPMEARTVFGDQ